MRNYGASEPVDARQVLIGQVKDWEAKFGKFPTQSAANKDQTNLANKLRRNRGKFTHAQKLELQELKDGPVGGFVTKG